MFLVYAIIWGIYMIKYKENLINVHYCILLIIGVSMTQSAINIILYQYSNRYGQSSTILITLGSLFEIARSTLSKVFTLMVSLGYGILKTDIQQYKNKIIIVSCLYVITLSAFNSLQIQNHHHHVSKNTAFLITFPLSFFNALFCAWIILSFKNTLKYLR